MSPEAPGCSTHTSQTEWFLAPSSLSCWRPWARPPLVKVALDTAFRLFPWCNQHSHSKYHGDLQEGRAERVCGFSFPGMIRGIITVLGKIIKLESTVGFSEGSEHTQAPALPEGSRGDRPPPPTWARPQIRLCLPTQTSTNCTNRKTYLMLALGPSPGKAES